MAADRCSAEILEKCKNYIKWKHTWRNKLHDWAYHNHYYSYSPSNMTWFYRNPPNQFKRIWFKIIWWIKELSSSIPPYSLTPDERIIVGMMLVGQYEDFKVG